MNAQHSQGLAKMKNETRLKVLIYERETYGQNGQNWNYGQNQTKLDEMDKINKIAWKEMKTK